MSKTGNTAENLPSSRITSRDIIKQIFASDHPEQFVRSVPAQSLFAALKCHGLESSSELIEIATLEQCRIMLDLDCWDRWTFREESFWEWLSITDDSDGLKILQKIIRTIDLKLVALIIARYVEFITFDEPTENPPAKGFYTPDNGFTWITISIQDGHQHFLLGRLMAMLFESDADLFYRLLAISRQVTQSELEEEAVLEREKRLESEGIPSTELSAAVHSAIGAAEIAALLKQGSGREVVADILPVYPLIYDTANLQPLSLLLAELGLREDVENEITHLINSGIVKWGVQFHDQEALRVIAQKIKGAMNIGLEECIVMSGLSAVSVFEILGLKRIYRFGLGKLLEYGKLAKRVRSEVPERLADEAALDAVLARAEEAFPAMPVFMKEGSAAKDRNKLETESCAIETRNELESLCDYLASVR